MIKTKRVYDRPEPDDGLRLLIMRRPIWINKAFREFQLNKERWKKELSPSDELLDAYKDGIVGWSEFVSRFIKEVDNPVSMASMMELGEKAKTTNVTLLCQEYEGESCHRHIIKELIDNTLRTKADSGDEMVRPEEI